MTRLCVILPENTWPKRGGTSELLYNFAYGLVKLRFNVFFASYINRYEGDLSGNFVQVAFKDYSRHASPRQVSAWIRAVKELFSILNLNANVPRMNLSIQFYRFLRSLLQRLEVDVALIGTCWPAPVSVAAAKASSIPTIQYLNAIESHPSHGLSLANRVMARITEDAGISGSVMTTVVSREDKEILLQRGYPDKKIEVIPNCVDYEKYQSISHEDVERVRKKLGVGDAPLIAFVGGLDYPPNKLAVRRIYESIAPRILKNLPEAKFLIIGPHPPSDYVHPSFIYAGGIYGQELASYVSAADVGIAPIEFGTGTRIKILEYFSAGKAVVSTSIGAMGLETRNGLDILIADRYDVFSDHLVKLLKEPAIRDDIGSRARTLAKGYSREALSTRLAALLSRAAAMSL